MERLKPVNRHILIVPHVKKNETNTGVLLPEDYESKADSYITATVVDVADDCAKEFKQFGYGQIQASEKKIVVDRSMVQEIQLKDSKHYLILENFVVGIYRRMDEN